MEREIHAAAWDIKKDWQEAQWVCERGTGMVLRFLYRGARVCTPLILQIQSWNARIGYSR